MDLVMEMGDVPLVATGYEEYNHTAQSDSDVLSGPFPLPPPQDRLWTSIREENDLMKMDLTDEPIYKYELRPGPRIGNNMLGGTLDKDDTGDFDPNAKIRRIKPRNKAPRMAHRPSDVNGISYPSDEEYENERLIVVLKANPTVLPSQHVQDLIEVMTDTYNLRSRVEIAVQQQNEEVLDERDLVGKPEARGCRSCRAFRTECSILHNEFEWPCQDCQETGEECVPMLQSSRKLECSHCLAAGGTKSGLICSYLYEHDHRGPCSRCRTLGMHCYAQPDPSNIYQRTRIDEDGHPKMNVRPKGANVRHLKSCVQCQKDGSTCSFHHDDPGHICVACDMKGVDCEVIEVGNPSQRPAMKQTHTQKSRVRTSQSSMPEAAAPSTDPASSSVARTNGTSMRSTTDTDGRGRSTAATVQPPRVVVSFPARPKILRVKTKFAHPILFLQDTIEGGCQFCDQLSFGILGQEEKDVLLKEVDPGVWHEDRGRHATQAVEGTKMCTYCTFERLQIIQCTQHKIVELQNIRLMSIHTAMSELKLSRDSNKWCSVCCNLAAYKCCAPRSDGSAGCGLLLCRYCSMMLQAVPFKGNFEQMLRALKDGSTAPRPYGLRADCGLLRQHGFLYEYVNAKRQVLQ